MSTIDQAQVRESPPAKDRHPNNCDTPPTLITLLMTFVQETRWAYSTVSIEPNEEVAEPQAGVSEQLGTPCKL